ncbi:cytochrome d ubiquinol oxidase subunit II [Solitalea sp. MAHUQ-68]|uniref:Cytochrome d ubiquinol oxidase subunit II n=1 Tax=Solitalea agri TaxID=2953739 RepID=A0A9X2EYT9_9SPHI|nr:cytochrome d ubiquinol oxidase subunit II [Solitalea agri]MCO4291512.1 cytochrome d ubiquinol oxidase subunit II [Solitalea agri]
MLYIDIAFLGLSILLYLLFGGADFGAGIIELFSSAETKNKTRKLTYKAIGPIWEANHMWLIITIVILFVGFPIAYTTITVHLHIPLLIMLFGIIARGTAFVFRHYDAVKDDMQKVYNLIFVYSSFITPLFLGIIAGSLMSGKINPTAISFHEGFIAPWFNLFSISVGLFTVCICGFLAAVYLIGEAKSADDAAIFISKAKWMNVATVLSGALVFIISEVEHIGIFRGLLTNRISLLAIIAASVSLFFLWDYLLKGKKNRVRILAGFQITMILFAVGYEYFPAFVLLKNNSFISLLENTAPLSTLTALGWALILGSLFILPALFYLYYSFQHREQEY